MIFGNPVRGTIFLTEGNGRWYRSQPFGCTGVPAERPLGNCAHFHRGIDVANGTCVGDILAAAAGTVHFAGRDTFGSIDVEIDHGGGQFTAYAHLSRTTVTVGQKVTKGQKIGLVGKTGNATGCHLHFAYKTGADPADSILGDDNGTWVDPWPLLAQNQPTHGGIMLGPITSHEPKLADFPAGEMQYLEDGKTPDTVKTAGGVAVMSPCAIGPLRGFWISVHKGVYGLRFAAPSKVYG